MVQTFIMYVVITVFMAPVVLGFGIPFIILAGVVYRWAAPGLSHAARLALACGVAALGIAPAYDAYAGPLPIYVRLLRNESVTTGAAVASVAATWILFLVVAQIFVRRPLKHS